MYCMNLPLYGQLMGYLLANIMDISTLHLSLALVCYSSILYAFLTCILLILTYFILSFFTEFIAYVYSIPLVSSPSLPGFYCSVRQFALFQQSIHTSVFSSSCFTQRFCHLHPLSRPSLLRFYLFSFELFAQFLFCRDCYLFHNLSVSLFLYPTSYFLTFLAIRLNPVPLSWNQCIQIY